MGLWVFRISQFCPWSRVEWKPFLLHGKYIEQGWTSGPGNASQGRLGPCEASSPLW